MVYEVTNSLPQGIERDQVHYIEEMCEHKYWDFVSYRHTRTTYESKDGSCVDEVRVYMYILDDNTTIPFAFDNSYVASKFEAGTAESFYDDEYNSDSTCADLDVFRDALPDALVDFLIRKFSDIEGHAFNGVLFEHLTKAGLALENVVDERIRELCRDSERLYKAEQHFAPLSEAYRSTTYQVETENGRIDLRIGQRSPELERLLAEHGAVKWEAPKTWAFLTAYNPRSVVLPPEENERRQTELEAELRAEGYTALPAQGVCDDAAWKPERSVFVIGIDSGKAFEFGRKWQQNAIVYGSFNRDDNGLRSFVPELGDCVSGRYEETFAEVEALGEQWQRKPESV